MMDRRQWCLTVVATVALPASAPSASDPASDPALLAWVMATLKALPARRAAFVEEKRLGSLNTPLRSEGFLVYDPPSHLEKVTVAPHPERLVIDGTQLTLDTGSGSPRSVDLNDNAVLGLLANTIRSVLTGDLATLQRYYSVTATGEKASWRLVLAPAEPWIGRVVRLVRADGTGADIVRIEIDSFNGDQQLMTIRATP